MKQVAAAAQRAARRALALRAVRPVARRWAVPRALALGALLAAVAVAAGPASAGGGRPSTAGPASPAGLPAALVSASGQRTARLQLGYSCVSPAGQQQITVQLSAGFPVGRPAGTPIVPLGARVAVTVPAPTAAVLARQHATAIAAAARLGLTATQGHGSATAVWAGLAAPATAIPSRGSLVLTAAGGAASSVTARSPGAVTFRAAALSLLLTGATTGTPTGGSSPTPTGGSSPTGGAGRPSATPVPGGPDRAATATPAAGPPASPVTLRLACTPDAGQRTTLATVSVAGTAARQQSPLAATALCPPQPKGGLKLNPRFPLPTPPKGSKILFPSPSDGCAYVEGYADVSKLNGASLVGPGLTDLALDVRVVEKLTSPIYYEIDSPAQLEYRPCTGCKLVHGFPPRKATFLGFGFVPVTAWMQLMERGIINIISVGSGFTLATNTVWSELTLRIYNVTVNGVPLNVGPHCQGATPFLAKLVGTTHSKPPYSLQNGGPLSGRVHIPAFTGCGVTENLDPLFTAAISGERNFTELTQGALCPLVGTGVCPPPIPTPLH